jgi:serine/threonine-protein kinase
VEADLPGSSPRPPARAGVASARFGSDGFSAELAQYVRARLRIAVRVLWLVAGAALALNLVERGSRDGWTPAALFDLEIAVLLSAVGITTVADRILRRPDLSPATISLLDAALLLMLLSVCVTTYHLDFDHGGGHGLQFAALLLVARAVVVPSAARRTFWLSVPAPIAAFLVQCIHASAGDPLPTGIASSPVAPFSGPWWGAAAWTQVVFGFALGIATMASRVNFRLRLRAYEAQRMGPYEVEGLLGSGGMGEVYRARHALMRRPVAIKFVKAELGGEALLARFEEEVRVTSRLTHPNTIAIYDYGTTAEGAFYYVMELLDGADLARIVRATGPLPAARVVHVLAQALDALAEAHAAGLVHRDIKAENLVLCRRGLDQDVIKVMDFGLVKDTQRGVSSPSVIGEVVGSPATMAPETLRGEPPTPATDLYSLGVVGCFLLTGRLPFEGRTAAELIVAHLQHEPIPPSSVRPDVPADVEAILLAALAKDPAGRPASAAAMRAALLACASARGWTGDDAAAWWALHGDAVRDGAAHA